MESNLIINLREFVIICLCVVLSYCHAIECMCEITEQILTNMCSKQLTVLKNSTEVKNLSEI